MDNYSKSVKTAYKRRCELLLIGLTGRTGSGCTTAASILKKNSFFDLDLHEPKKFDFLNSEERKYAINYDYLKNNHNWQPFTVIEGSSIIFSYVIQEGIENLKKYFENYKQVDENNKIRISAYQEFYNALSGTEYMFKKHDLCKIDDIELILSNKELVNKYYKFYINELPRLRDEFKKLVSDFTCHEEYIDKFSQTKYIKLHLYTFFMQQIGNNIRCSGNAYSPEYTEENFYSVAERMDKVIRIICKYNEIHLIQNTRICIDAIRNPYEAYYFKDKYSAFYLFSVNTEDSTRKNRLGNLDDEELESLDNIECPQKFNKDYEVFFHQNIPGCLEISDIHLYNPQHNNGKNYFLTEQIIKYISLMLHPGLITPSNIERCMQLAYNTKLNSGCLSRQVGAIITGSDYSVKAVGWNDVPEGQVSCNLRDVRNYCANKDPESYSEYEIENNVFHESIETINNQLDKCEFIGRSYPYCFKDIYNGIKNDKNQVYTRSLHAEENAFLQLAKNGGDGIKGGCLFTTASPCELCAKKAYQLGIKHIYYIDPYPGISMQHILKFGTTGNPEMHLFYGAIGNAYVSLYVPRIPIKDELNLLSGVDCKKVRVYKNKKHDVVLGLNDIKYTKQHLEFVFQTRENIYTIETIELEALHDGIKQFTNYIYWTGSSYDGIEILDCDHEFVFEDKEISNPPYLGLLTLTTPLNKGEKLSYTSRTAVKDTTHIMIPYYSKIISMRTSDLEIKVKAPTGLMKDVSCVVYADTDMSKEMEIDRFEAPASISDDYETFLFSIPQPNLNYSYCLEWNFG